MDFDRIADVPISEPILVPELEWIPMAGFNFSNELGMLIQSRELDENPLEEEFQE